MSDAEKLRVDSEQVTLDFIATEIQTGMSFMNLAITEYASGNRSHGDAVRAKAQTAFDEAEQRMKQAEARGYAVTSDMREDLRTLRDRIQIAGKNDG